MTISDDLPCLCPRRLDAGADGSQPSGSTSASSEIPLAAFCILDWVPRRGFWALRDLCTASSHQGYAPQMLVCVAEWLRGMGLPAHLWADVNNSNLGCVRLFENVRRRLPEMRPARRSAVISLR